MKKEIKKKEFKEYKQTSKIFSSMWRNVKIFSVVDILSWHKKVDISTTEEETEKLFPNQPT